MSQDLRSKVHTLIDNIIDDSLLQKIHDLLADQGKTGVWHELTDQQRERIMQAYDASFDPQGLLSTEEVMKRRLK